MAGLEQLRMCELLERARAMGAPQDVLDELMDSSDPRQALTRMLQERATQAEEGELGELVARLREDAELLATAVRLEKNDQRHVRSLETLSTMIELAANRPDVALELACMQVPETVAVIMQDAFERDPLVVHGAVLPPAMLLLSTLSAYQGCHAWFTGSGAVTVIVAALNLREEWAGELVPLAAAALANLATPPATQEPSHESEASTAVAKEILAAGGLVPLIALVEGARTEGAGCSPEHARAQQWAAAALMNFSQHGQRARAVLIRRGAVDAIAVALRRLVAEADAAADAPKKQLKKERQAKRDRRRETGEERQATKESGTAALSPGATIEMLLGCLANIAPHDPEELLEVGAIEASLQVLEKATLHTPRGEHIHPMHEAAAALIRHTAEAGTLRNISGETGGIDVPPVDSALTSHGLLSLSERLAAIAKQRPASVSVCALLEHIDLITFGEVTEPCRTLLLELEQVAESEKQASEHNEAEAQAEAQADTAKIQGEEESEDRLRQHAAAAEMHIQKVQEDHAHVWVRDAVACECDNCGSMVDTWCERCDACKRCHPQRFCTGHSGAPQTKPQNLGSQPGTSQNIHSSSSAGQDSTSWRRAVTPDGFSPERSAALLLAKHWSRDSVEALLQRPEKLRTVMATLCGRPATASAQQFHDYPTRTLGATVPVRPHTSGGYSSAPRLPERPATAMAQFGRSTNVAALPLWGVEVLNLFLPTGLAPRAVVYRCFGEAFARAEDLVDVLVLERYSVAVLSFRYADESTCKRAHAALQDDERLHHTTNGWPLRLVKEGLLIKTYVKSIVGDSEVPSVQQIFGSCPGAPGYEECEVLRDASSMSSPQELDKHSDDDEVAAAEFEAGHLRCFYRNHTDLSEFAYACALAGFSTRQLGFVKRPSEWDGQTRSPSRLSLLLA